MRLLVPYLSPFLKNLSLYFCAMSKPAVIVIGAGASGLMSALELSAAAIPVILLEADPVAGGRIHTLQLPGLVRPVEAGAEFVHGELPLTFRLLHEAGISYHPVQGKMVQIRKGRQVGEGPFPIDWNLLEQKMEELAASKEDMPIARFMDSRFPGDEYALLRDSVQHYAEGYDLADPATASTLSLYREWTQEDHLQYRIEGGYGRLIDHLLDTCRSQGAAIHFDCPVREIRWKKGQVEVVTAGGQSFSGSRVIVTVPLGVLQADPPGLLFSPSIPVEMKAIRQLGYGSVTKILLQFRQAFWNSVALESGSSERYPDSRQRLMSDESPEAIPGDQKTGFILSDGEIPTWWGQGDDTALLTGWVTGQARRSLRGLDEGQILQRCLSSLAAIFSKDPGLLAQELVAFRIFDWALRPYIKGAYSFDMVESEAARSLLRRPVADTVYFAGEGFYEGVVPGTVEAALTSGKEAADALIRQLAADGV